MENKIKEYNISQSPEQYDAIVVGSGISGGWAAKELTENGLKTLLLERGRDVKHGEDYKTEHMPPWEAEFRGRGDRKLFEEEYPMQLRSDVINEYNYHFFVNDKEHPYQTDEEDPFLWVRGYHVGGRSLTWGRQTYRWSDLDFEANLNDDIAVDWPIRYEDIEPWYDYVENFIGVSGQEEGLDHLPDGQFLPPMDMNCVEKDVREKIKNNFEYRTMTIGRCAVLTEPHKGRGSCHYCGPCSRGCSVGAYFSSQSSTLPAARKTGNLTLRPNSIVHSIIYDKETNRATGVRVIDRLTKETKEFYANVIFLNASALGSTQIMLNSTSEAFPNGIANSSGVLGHYLMDHHFRVGASGSFEGYTDRYYHGNRPNGIYIPRFRNINEQTIQDSFIRGYGFQGGASRSGWGRGTNMKGFGEEFKNKLRDPGQWNFWLTAFGEILPYEDNYAELSDKTDDWGIPQLEIHGSIKDNEHSMRKDMAATAAEMLEAAGAKNVSTNENEYLLGEGIHEMGTARMGRDPKTSVLNAHNQAHDVPNLFVTDGACMTSAACQNPSITYMALTARAVDFAVEEMKKGNI
ncbi:GMC oxidoreductase [Fodinibius salsisoli]|uniref:GMC family oxidoreductase n=1 Tax=Fodinibius salsisoli TaxID=2820877 RepID=A0ABT3PKK3_9BACT|nr:GMC family oxidoreductase [Fodinibius salsisoli]MCW9706470.1 GMC family oxidoreductase [Fodinibius salsisoli]